jgi:hypothetical protein
LYVYVVHFCWATFFCLLSLFLLRFYPTSTGGMILTGLVLIVLVGVVASLTGFTQWTMMKTGLATPIPVTATVTIPSPTAIRTSTIAPTAETTEVLSAVSNIPSPTQELETSTPEPTLAPTGTATATVTSEPTPIIGIIRASEGGGAFIREKPGGIVLKTLGNGATVTIIPNDIQEVNKVIWVHVFTLVNDQRVEGWMIQTVLQTATPVANWQPSLTPAGP